MPSLPKLDADRIGQYVTVARNSSDYPDVQQSICGPLTQIRHLQDKTIITVKVLNLDLELTLEPDRDRVSFTDKQGNGIA